VRRTVPSLVSVALCILLAGCAPQGSLFPVYTSDDVYFDESLDGSWRTMDSDQKSDDDLHLSFKGDKDGQSYLVVARSDEKEDVRMFMEARLVHIGKYEFIDFATPSEQNVRRRENPRQRLSGHFWSHFCPPAQGTGRLQTEIPRR
jgi:hypothetical protein